MRTETRVIVDKSDLNRTMDALGHAWRHDGSETEDLYERLLEEISREVSGIAQQAYDLGKSESV